MYTVNNLACLENGLILAAGDERGVITFLRAQLNRRNILTRILEKPEKTRNKKTALCKCKRRFPVELCLFFSISISFWQKNES